ncbi:hypothetical protein [Sphingomonas sp. GB1N7]|uniref:hypothetical protein n=1 Tax=Parasphingomonas caseinilytica TaxID=3096158 RepID=UPI002FC70506
MGYKIAPWIMAAGIAIFIAYIVRNDEAPARFAPINRIDEPILFRFVIGFYVILFFLSCYIGVRLL